MRAEPARKACALDFEVMVKKKMMESVLHNIISGTTMALFMGSGEMDGCDLKYYLSFY